VCSKWQAIVDSQLISQVCCQHEHLRKLGRLTGLRHVLVEGTTTYLRGRLHRQQRLWAHARCSTRTGRLVPAQALPSPRGDLSPLAQLPGVQAVTLRCLPLLRHNFQQQAAYLTHLTSLTLHQPDLYYHPGGSCDAKHHLSGTREALAALPQLKALALVHVSPHITAQALRAPQQQCTQAPAPSSSCAGLGVRAGTSPVPCPWLAGLQSLAVRCCEVPSSATRDALASLTSCTPLDLSNSTTGKLRLSSLTRLKVCKGRRCNTEWCWRSFGKLPWNDPKLAAVAACCATLH
jgi:hypothetical protein